MERIDFETVRQIELGTVLSHTESRRAAGAISLSQRTVVPYRHSRTRRITELSRQTFPRTGGEREHEFPRQTEINKRIRISTPPPAFAEKTGAVAEDRLGYIRLNLFENLTTARIRQQRTASRPFVTTSSRSIAFPIRSNSTPSSASPWLSSNFSPRASKPVSSEI